MASEVQKSAIDFIDILFALVVGSALEVIARTGHMSAAGRTHLALAGLLTIMSWIGYHNSEHRYPGQIKFNLKRPVGLTALGKFLIDIGLVVVYWLAVRTTEGGFDHSSLQPSWSSASLLTVLAFCGYAVWDWLAWIGPREGGSERHPYLDWRRVVTLMVLMVVLIILIVLAFLEPMKNHSVAVSNGILCVAVVGYRFLKDMDKPRWFIRLQPRRLTEMEPN